MEYSSTKQNKLVAVSCSKTSFSSEKMMSSLAKQRAVNIFELLQGFHPRSSRELFGFCVAPVSNHF
jgi:hypothetical protein